MSLTSRTIEIEHDGDLIEVQGWVKSDKLTAVWQLYVNHKLQSQLEPKIVDAVIGNTYTLHGRTRNNSIVKAHLRAHLFMRPKYTITVNDLEIHQEKGVWGFM